MIDEKEVIDWLRKKDHLALMDLLSIMRKDQHPVIMSNEEYERFLSYAQTLQRMRREIKELLNVGTNNE